MRYVKPFKRLHPYLYLKQLFAESFTAMDSHEKRLSELHCKGAMNFVVHSWPIFPYFREINLGSNARDHARRYGYAIRGCTPVTHRLLVRGKRVNAIAALTSDGIIAVDTVIGSVSGHTFFDFLRGTLIPHLMPFNGANPHSVLILDNCSIHHIVEVKDLLHQAGILVLFLPPYSPDLNPIEEAFNYIKAYLKKHDILLQSGAPLPTVIDAGFESISKDHCNAWITDSGYPL